MKNASIVKIRRIERKRRGFRKATIEKFFPRWNKKKCNLATEQASTSLRRFSRDIANLDHSNFAKSILFLHVYVN